VFKTATGVVLSTDVNPNMMRLFKQKSQGIYATSSECAMLNQMYAQSDLYRQYQLKTLMKKVECKLDLESISLRFDTITPDDTDSIDVVQEAVPLKLFRSGFSVFAIM
jgi:hypothetical protein